MTLAPDAVVLGDDPGDDTARRYRYQWTYAAVLCCTLLDETSEIAEIFCEHHEDVLIKRQDGTFVGAQIKTRSTSQSAWKTTDDGVRGSCVRFAKLEARFPGYFSGFLFLSNHPLHSAKNGQDLRHVLSLVASTSSEQDLAQVAKRFVKAVARDAGCSESTVLAALRKTSARDDLPKLRDADVRLVDTLASVWSRATECAYASVQRVANHLVEECGRASSLAHEQVLPAYLPAMPDPQATEIKALVDGKRIDKDRLLGVLDQAVDHVATLDFEATAIVEPGAGQEDLLLKKLAAGGFSIVSCNSAMDLRDKADYLGITWTKKLGRERGLKRYGHVRSLVLKDAGTAFEGAKHPDTHFGVEMLARLRELLRGRRLDRDQIYDCSTEHLEGFAYSLTAQCKVQWSIDRPWEKE